MTSSTTANNLSSAPLPQQQTEVADYTTEDTTKDSAAEVAEMEEAEEDEVAKAEVVTTVTTTTTTTRTTTDLMGSLGGRSEDLDSSNEAKYVPEEKEFEVPAPPRSSSSSSSSSESEGADQVPFWLNQLKIISVKNLFVNLFTYVATQCSILRTFANTVKARSSRKIGHRTFVRQNEIFCYFNWTYVIKIRNGRPYFLKSVL